MKTIKLPFTIIVLLILVNCTESQKTETLLNYKVLKNEVYDAPVKTQVHLDVLITEKKITKKEVSTLLLSLYEKTIKRTGFKYHDNPTNIFIYAYTSKEKAESGRAQWIGMISKSFDDTQPDITISSTQFNSLTVKQVEKYGLSESVRMDIWKKCIKIEDRAQVEADKKYSLNRVGLTTDEIKKNSSLFEKLKKNYEKELSDEYGIGMVIIDSIVVEGLTNGWPFPQ